MTPSKRAAIEGKGEEAHFKNQENLKVLFKLNKLRNLRKEEHSRINSIRRLKTISQNLKMKFQIYMCFRFLEKTQYESWPLFLHLPELSFSFGRHSLTSSLKVSRLKWSFSPRSSRMVTIASFVCWIFSPSIDPLMSNTKTMCFGREGKFSGAKKWTKYPSWKCSKWR